MNLLFLAHRIPFPPDKGEKIRAYNMLLHLATSHTVHLGCFVDDPADFAHIETVRQLARGSCLFEPINRLATPARLLGALVGGQPLTTSYFASKRFGRWVGDVVRKNSISRAIVFGSAMAPFLLARRDFDPAQVVFDMVDVDSDKWRQYASGSGGARAWIYEREARVLFALERRGAEMFGATTFVSRAERDTFLELAPGIHAQLCEIQNGIDLDYFNPHGTYPNPFAPGETPIVMTGTFNYRPNEEAAVWFAQSVLPIVQAELPTARFYAVGAKPAARLRSLPRKSVTVTGYVEDVRPYLAHASVVVAPLHMARGVQNKVLEGMAMRKPIVATSPATRALGVSDCVELRIADAPADFARAVLLAGDAREGARLAQNARRYVERHHNWATNLQILDRLIETPRLAGIREDSCIEEALSQSAAG